MKLITANTPIYSFLQELKVGEIFGFSARFKKEAIIGWADDLGISVAPPGVKTPERKQYGDYVMRVRSMGMMTKKSLFLGRNEQVVIKITQYSCSISVTGRKLLSSTGTYSTLTLQYIKQMTPH